MAQPNKAKKKAARTKGTPAAATKLKSSVLGHDPFMRRSTPRQEPQPHAETPRAYELTGAVPHSGSPSIAADPQPHAGAPTGQSLKGPVAHPASPQVIETHAPQIAVEPTREFRATATDAVKGAFRALRLTRKALPTSNVDSFGKDAALSSSLRPLGEFLFEKYWRVKIEGTAHLPHGPFIVVANHGGGLPLDGPVLHLALRRERPELKDSRWLVEEQVLQTPLLGSLVNRLGAVRATPENALHLLEQQHPLIVFPEGFGGLSKPFSERYQLKRFGRGGYLKIALRAKVPVVAAAIVGAEETTPLLAKLPGAIPGLQYLPLAPLPLPARWHIRFAAPLSLSDAPPNAEDDASWVDQQNQAVRNQISGMLTQMREQRERIF